MDEEEEEEEAVEPELMPELEPGQEEEEFYSDPDPEVMEPMEEPEAPQVLRARVEIMSSMGKHGYEDGFVLFEQVGDETRVTGVISGLTEGLHGFHVHEFGNLEYGCDSTGGHYNPTDDDHGSPDMDMRHIGDLGNIEAESIGVAIIDQTVTNLPLSGPYSIIGRAVVVHADEDDFMGESGNAGPRVACGVIGNLQS